MTDILVKKACELLENKSGFVIATIISHEGSTPRISGTKMIITGDGSINGTIGGGLLEARVIKKAVKIIAEKPFSTFMPFDLSYDDVNSMDMICGGRAEIFLDQIIPSYENAEIFKAWNHLLEQRENGFFLTAVVGDQDNVEQVYHGVFGKDRVLHGTLPLTDDALEKIAEETGKAPSLRAFNIENALVIIEPAIKPKVAFLFGAGHVAKPTAHLCALTGFYVTVLDDRKEFANVQNFPDSQEVRVLENFERAFENLYIDDDSFIVIFTRGHLHDRTVLAGALKTEAGYIGMIGSRKKRDNIYKALFNTGYHQKDIDRVHSPIGLPIGGRSPEEIAVSIVAEMIQQRARMSK
ncbi:MAG: XdhC/CoxI family protein [Desulfobacterales bacterium]